MSLANKFLFIADKFLESDASVVQLSTRFNEYVDDAKLRSSALTNKDKAVETEILLNCILQYLHCIIEYAGGGSAHVRSANVRQLCNKIYTTVEELNVKNEFIKNLSLPTFEFLFGQPSWIAKEVLRMYGDTIQTTDRAVRFEAVQEKGPYYLGRLMDAIPFGDFEFQVMIVETLYRMCTKEILNDMPKVNFLTQEQTEAFYNIVTDEFDLTVRHFLNLLNEKEKHVVSLLCNKVTFDDIQLQEPPELKPFNGMWVDFNVTAGTVTLFINNEPFNTLDIRWEMITLFPENIIKTETSFAFNEEKGRKEGIAKFVLKGPCMLCYTSSQNKLLNCRLLTLHSLDTERFREVFFQIFPKIHKKPKQASTLSYKRAYKPLDVISVKSSATNPSTVFNMTIDSILAGKKHKSRSGGTKSVTFADSTMHTNSSKSRSLSSRKSINISLNQSFQDELDSISSINRKINNSKGSGDRKLKRNAEFDEVSAVSNLSVDKLIETRRNSGKGFGSKKLKLSGLEELHHLSTQEKSKIVPHSKYNDEFLSSLMELGEDIDVFSEYNKNINSSLDRKKKSEFMQKEADSTTLVGGLYNNEIILLDESITSDVFHSIEDIDNDSTKENFEAKYGKNRYKKDLISKRLKTKQDKTITHMIVSSPEGNLSDLSVDEVLPMKKNDAKEKVARKKWKSKIHLERSNISEEHTRVRENTDRVGSLGIELSPDLFIIESQESGNENFHSNAPDEFPKHTRAKNRMNLSTKSCTLLEMQESLWIDPVRDCQFNEFDKLKLERPRAILTENPKNENLPEPDLIQISQLPFSTPIENFETAQTNLDNVEEAQVPCSGNNLDLFQDISQKNYSLQSGCQEESPEIDVNLSEEYKTKIKVFSNIQIQSSVWKSQMSVDGSQKSQIRNLKSKQKENISPAEEIKMPGGVSQTSDRNSNSQLVKESSAIKQSAKNNSNANNLEADVLSCPSRGISKNIENLITDKKHKIEAAKSHSETQITVHPEKIVVMEQTINCESTSQEVQYSETQRTDSQTMAPIYEEITSQPSNEEEPMECGEIFPTEQPLDIQKDESKFCSLPKSTEVLISQRDPNCEVQLPTSQKNYSQSIPSFEEKKLHQKKKELRSNTGQEGKKNVVIINDIVIKECGKSDSVCEESKKTKIENLFTDQKHKIKASNNTYSETKTTVLPEKRVLIEETIDCKPTSQESQYSETQRTDSQNTPPKYDVVASQPSHEEDPKKCEETFPTEQLLDFQKDEGTLNCEVQSPKFKKKYSQSIPSFEEKKLHQKKNKTKCNTTQKGKKKIQIIHDSTIKNLKEKSQGEHIENLFTDQTHKAKGVKNTDSETQITVLPEKRVLREQTIDCNATSQELQYLETQKNGSQTMPPKFEVISSKLSHEEPPMECRTQVKDAKNTNSETQITVLPEQRVLTEQTIGFNTTSQELQDSETQKTDSQTMLPKYEVITSQLSHVEDPMECEEILPTEQPLDIQKDKSQCTLLSKKKKQKLHQKKKELKSSTSQKRMLILNDIKERIQIDSCYEKSKKNKIEETCIENDASQSLKLSDYNIVEKLGCAKEVSETKTIKKKSKIPKVPSRITSKINIQNDNLRPSVKLTNMAPTVEKRNLSIIIEMDEDDIPLSQLKQLLKSKISNEIITPEDGEKAQIQTEPLHIDVNENSVQYSKKNEIPKKLSRVTSKIEVQNDNLRPYVEITTMIPTVKKKNLSNTTERNEKDLPLPELKQLLKSKKTKQITQIAMNEDTVQFSKLQESCLPQYADDGDERNVEIQINQKGEVQSPLKYQRQKDRKREENIHDTVNKEECGGKFVDRVDINDSNSEVKSNTLLVMKEKKHMCENDTLKKPIHELDNEPDIVGKSSFENCQEIKNQKQAKNDILKQSESSNFIVIIEDPDNKGNELFQKFPERPAHKKANLPKQISVPDQNEKLENSEENEVDEIHKSLLVLFGEDVNEPVTKNINSVPPKTLDKIDKHPNSSADATNSIIAGSIGMLKRGRKLFNPENHEENFMNFTLIEEAMEKDMEKPNKLQNVSKYNEKNKKQLTKLKFDKEVHKESKKIKESEAERQGRKHEKNKFKRYSDVQEKQHRLSKFDFVNHSRKRKLDALYDIVVERLHSQHGSTRKSYSVPPKVKKNKHESKSMKYDLEFSTIKESLLEKEQYESKIKHSSNKVIESNKEDGDRSKERNVMESQQDDTDETIRLILKGFGTLCQNIAQGTLKKPSPSKQKILFAAADLLLSCD